MATTQDFIDYVIDQSGLGATLSFKKMFGEYAVYVDGKVTALAADNQLFLKPTPEGRQLLANVVEAPPYPGAKLCFMVNDCLEDRALLAQLLLTTAKALPDAKPKAPPKAKSAPKAKAAPKAKPKTKSNTKSTSKPR